MIRPGNPGKPSKPGRPGKPGSPCGHGCSHSPGGPLGPGTPEIPGIPLGPVGPFDPAHSHSHRNGLLFDLEELSRPSLLIKSTERKQSHDLGTFNFNYYH